VFAGDWQAAWDGIVGIFSGIWEGIVAYVKVPINAIIGFINGLISGIVGGINLVIGVGLYFRYSCNFQSRSMVQCNRTAGTLISP
jgi:hypothetical protein